MRDYAIATLLNSSYRPVAACPSEELRYFLRRVAEGRVEHAGISGAATQQDVVDRIRLELEIRAMGLTSA